MRKTVIDPATVHSDSRTEPEWFDLEEMAKVEVTSEDPSFPVESATLRHGRGTRGEPIVLPLLVTDALLKLRLRECRG